MPPEPRRSLTSYAPMREPGERGTVAECIGLSGYPVIGLLTGTLPGMTYRSLALCLVLGVSCSRAPAAPAAASVIAVGPNVLVSAGMPKWEHTEYMANAHPSCDHSRVGSRAGTDVEHGQDHAALFEKRRRDQSAREHRHCLDAREVVRVESPMTDLKVTVRVRLRHNS